MTLKVGINGYGRIGRNVLRALYEAGRQKEIRIVAVNDLGDAETNAYLTRHDTVHGRFRGEVRVDGDHMVVDGDRIRVLAERDPSKLPWGELGVDTVFECTGLFTSKAKAGQHLAGGAKRVIVSAPGEKDVDATIVYGVNHQVLKPAHDRDLERVLHDQLPGAAGQAAARCDRRQGRHHDDDPRVHERPGADRRLPQGPAAGALGHDVDDPDQDRRGGGGRPRASGAERQARRLRGACADDQRIAGRPHLHGGARDLARGGQQGAACGLPGRAQGDPQLQRRAAGLGGLQP